MCLNSFGLSGKIVPIMDSGLSPSRNSDDPLLILRAGDALTEVAAEHGEYGDWIQRAADDAWEGGWVEHDLRGSNRFPDWSGVAGIIITGSPASVTERAPWMLRTE